MLEDGWTDRSRPDRLVEQPGPNLLRRGSCLRPERRRLCAQQGPLHSSVASLFAALTNAITVNVALTHFESSLTLEQFLDAIVDTPGGGYRIQW